MWNDLYKEEPPAYVEITCIRHSFGNILIWKRIWFSNCGIREVRSGGSEKEQVKGVSSEDEMEGMWGQFRAQREKGACQRPPSSDRRGWEKAVTLKKKRAARPRCQPSSWPVALKPEKSGHSVSLDPADLKRFLRWTLEGTLLPPPFSLISEITVVFPACV